MRIARFPTVLSGYLFLSAGVLTSIDGEVQSPSQQPVPIFRTGLDVARVTVRVLDQRRRPIRGLKLDDFTVFVNGVEQPIVAVAEEDSAGPVTPPAAWMRDVAPDVATNRIRDPRLVVIIMDDANFGAQRFGDPWSLKQAKLIGRAIVEQLGPQDLAAVVFTGDNRAPQDFTSDRTRLYDAVDRFNRTGIPPQLAAQYAMRTLQSVVKSLQKDTDRPGAIFCITPGIPISRRALESSAVSSRELISEREEELTLLGQVHRLVNDENARAVPIYPIDISGLKAPTPRQNGIIELPPMSSDSGMALRDIALATGGRAIVNTNAPSAGVRELFHELAVHYVIGYRVTHPDPDGRYRRLRVRVNRPGLSIEPPERLWLAPRATTEAAVVPEPLAETARAMSGLIPLADEPLRLAITPFAIPGGVSERRAPATLVWTLGLETPTAPEARPDEVAIELRIFDAEGRRQLEMSRHIVRLQSMPASGRDSVEVVSALTLAPGRYNVRVSVHSVRRNRAGSVHTDVDIPEFARDSLSVSGVVIETTPALPRVPIGSNLPAVPAVPTTLRDFVAKRDRVTAFVRLHWGGSRAAAPVKVRTAIVDDVNATVWQREAAVVPPSSGLSPRLADYRTELPLGDLRPGDYLLRSEIIPASGRPIVRAVRFRLE